MEVIAHRGASAYAPENTMTAFEMALDMGAKAVEFDVQMTLDGQLVVIHDDYLDRTTSGSGLVIETPYTSIKDLDAGIWFGTQFAGEKVPLLKEVLLLLKAKVKIHLEIKKISWETRSIEEDIYQMVKALGMLDQVVFSSFDHRCLNYLEDTYGVAIGVLTQSGLINPTEYLEVAGLRAFSYNPLSTFVDEKLVTECHQKGLKVYTYTVNRPCLAEGLAQMKVDGIFSNYPDILEG